MTQDVNERLREIYNTVRERYAGELDGVIRNADDSASLDGVVKLFDGFFNGDIDVQDVIGSMMAYSRKYTGKDKNEVEKAIASLAREVNGAFEEKGIYSVGNLMTGQEHSLMGSSGQANSQEPWKPRILLERQGADIDLLNAQRERQGSFPTLLAQYFGLKVYRDTFVQVSLEPLDKNGNTIRDPVPLDEKGQALQIYVKSSDFPFMRERA